MKECTWVCACVRVCSCMNVCVRECVVREYEGMHIGECVHVCVCS